MGWEARKKCVAVAQNLKHIYMYMYAVNSALSPSLAPSSLPPPSPTPAVYSTRSAAAAASCLAW